MTIKPPRMFKFNGSIVFHTDEQIEQLKKIAEEKGENKFMEEFLRCEVKYGS